MWVCSPKMRTPRTRRPRGPGSTRCRSSCREPGAATRGFARGTPPSSRRGGALAPHPADTTKGRLVPPRDSLPLKPFAVSEPLGTSSGPRGAARVKVTAAGAARPAPRCASASEGSRAPGDFIGSPSEMLSRTPEKPPALPPQPPPRLAHGSPQHVAPHGAAKGVFPPASSQAHVAQLGASGAAAGGDRWVHLAGCLRRFSLHFPAGRGGVGRLSGVCRAARRCPALPEDVTRPGSRAVFSLRIAKFWSGRTFRPLMP